MKRDYSNRIIISINEICGEISKVELSKCDLELYRFVLDLNYKAYLYKKLSTILIYL